MKRYMTLALVLLAGAAGIVFVQREHVSTHPSPEALLMAAADAQHELTRVPAHLDPMTDAEEIAMGTEMASQISTRWGRTPADPSHDVAMQEYLQSVGTRVAAHTRRQLTWTFHYIPSPGFVNAFALPGGHVFVGEGLIRLMGSEDALAAVLGHEVEHIDLRHCAERAQADARIRQLGVLEDISGLPLAIFMAGYSKEQELEADRDGTTLAVQAGYSYTGILQLLNSFTKLETDSQKTSTKSGGPISEAGELSLATLSGYVASHPPSRQRSESVRELANQRGWPANPARPLLSRGLPLRTGT